jgi:PAS domain S-box-containing protein
MPTTDSSTKPKHGALLEEPNQNMESPERAVLDRGEQLAQTGSWEWCLDTDAFVWSDNMFRLFGLDPGEIVPTPADVTRRIHPEDRERVQRSLDSAAQLGTPPPELSYRVLLPGGTVHVLHSSVPTVTEERDGRPSRLTGSVQDITELSAMRQRADESLKLVETLQSAAPVGFAFVDREFRVVRINQALAEVNGAAPEDQIGRTLAELVPDVWAQMEPIYRRVLETGEVVSNFAVERRRLATQDYRYWLASCYPVTIENEVIGVGVAVLDVTERHEADLLRAAVMDTMVEGLYVLDGAGRVTFMNSAASKILGWSEDELRGKSMHTAIHFQRADGSPHPESECELLKVRTLGRSVRMAHEAFTRKDGTICPVAYSAAPLHAGTANGGVVVVFRNTTAEQAGETRVKRELDTLAWVGRIRDALDEDRMTLYSQPIVALGDGRSSQELLLRMVGSNGEITPPGSFLGVAEEYGLIGEIDRWVITQAVRLAAGSQRVHLNLSAESISRLDLLPLIERELREWQTDPSNLVFEITETALMASVDAGEAFAHGLSALGCQIALDDFGTGFGSFTYLKSLPITYVKIDVDFVFDLIANEANQYVVKAIVSLCRDFGYQTIAEGVEDAVTLALLGEFGVDFAQGFHIGSPVPMARV